MFNLIKSIVVIIMLSSFSAQAKSIWQIGKSDNSSADLALGPADYKKFLSRDFGYEDRYFLVGTSNPRNDFPYVLPGPADTWGGTWGTSGWRTHEINILFGIKEMKSDEGFKLVIDLADSQPTKSLLKVSVNNQHSKFLLKGASEGTLSGDMSGAVERIIEIPIDKDIIQKGGNSITITILEGSWVVFDQVRLEGPDGTVLTQNDQVFVRSVKPATYELEAGKQKIQPLLVDVEHLTGQPKLEVKLDKKAVYSTFLDSARYQIEVPMPSVKRKKKSQYEIYIDGKKIEEGSILRSPQALQSLADYVDTRIGTAHSRWMIAPGPWMPFSMVKMSPDNQNRGWQAGYQPSFETIGTFSHIHEWTMGGLGMMPTNGKLQTKVGDQFDPDAGYRSRIDKSTEEAPLGFYKVYMSDTKIWAEVTATTRGGFQRYTFPKDQDGRVMIDMHVEAEYDYLLSDVEINKVSDYRIEGRSHQISPRPTVWSNDADQEYVVNFVIEFDQPIKNVGGWINDQTLEGGIIKGKDLKDAGIYVEFDTNQSNVVQARSAISLVSIENAAENLKTEISDPFGWDFEAVVQHQKDVWNDYLSRITIASDNRLEKVRFYSNFFRSLCRNTWSDVNGEWIAPDETKQKFEDPSDLALGCDAFWNTFWNLNQLWNLATPEWSSKWVKSQLAMYDANGWLGKGPAGMEYIPVMVAEHEIPQMVSAYQMGIRDFDVEKTFEAVKKMQTTPATEVAGGFAGNRDLITYLDHKYVPSDKGRFSNTLEYSYDDWTVGQLAKSLGKKEDYKVFSDRGNWWKNAFNPKNGFAQLRNSKGEFEEPFDPFQSGRNHHYVEGNSWQLSYFVPQDVPALVDVMGKEAFVERLDWGFKASEPWRYNAPNDQYWDYPVVQGNQQSMHFAFLFNWADHPWLTQKWSRSILEKYYGSGLANAYLGDEDQGQMSAWFVMASIGLFQMDGGTSATPIYEIASPLYSKITIDLKEMYGRGKQFIIEAKNSSRKNIYVQKAYLNGKELKSFWFPASELLKGGKLVLEMGDQPNKNWGRTSDK
ncbi:GH92 family glycosyl hydrolase [Echinicola marina]|uniref:GH92 family glycosyl hydrolase n=1 Tax=Echinicola marina TaxID=2859768 RepID=UPI001CF714FB|nr:GH92 family glycosyl hydrolase [Echinicola marina]UCS91719.1 GH92 family glycosyl hydrolase [Echinicola marina]